ncbi:hypothetical protein KL938_000498 [Ogataea parapolymorpha]|nr:hypothetical protein KL938_000498 [Ogataea parapolymorpha]
MYLIRTETEHFHKERHELLMRRSLEQQYEEEASRPASEEAGLQFFPDITGWDIIEIQEWAGCVDLKPASVWSVGAINTFYHLLERRSNEKQKFGHLRGFALFTNAPINAVIEIANKSFGFNQWESSLVEDTGRVVRYRKHEFDDERGYRYDLEYAIDTCLRLADGTVARKTGFGVAQWMPSKGLAFSYAKKQAATDGLKACFYAMVALLEQYEEKLIEGYYD